MNGISSDKSSWWIPCGSCGKTEVASACDPSPPSVPVVGPRSHEMSITGDFITRSLPHSYRKLNPIQIGDRHSRSLLYDWVGEAGEIANEATALPTIA